MDIEQKLVDILTKLENLAVDFAPEAMELALATVRINAIGAIIVGLVCLVVAVLGISLTIDGIRNNRNWAWWRYEYIDDEISPVIAAPIAVVVFALIGAFTTLFNIWTWVAIFNPTLALARQVLGL